MKGWIDRIFGDSEKDKFARTFSEALKKAGDPRSSSYDRDEFRLVFSEDDSVTGYLNLTNLFAEYSKVDPSNREACLRGQVRASLSHFKEIPSEFADASHDIRPRLWARSTYEQIKLQFRLNDQGEPPDWPIEPIGEHLILMLVYDLPESVSSISTEQLAEWGVTYWQAREVAFENLEATEMEMVVLGDELYASNTGDTYDATRMVLPELIDRISQECNPLLMVPNRDTLLISPDDSDVGQKMMLEFAAQQLEEEPRSLIATVMTLNHENEWVDWLPGEGEVLFADYQKIKLQWFAEEYHSQKQLLDAIHENESRDVFVATYSVLERNEILHSYCVWSEGVNSLLPETDLICLNPSNGSDPIMLKFSDAQQCFGESMYETDYYPKRFHVSQFPAVEQLAEVKSKVINMDAE